ncbi:2209_t:CDS:1 [Paraglomus brasilianum]|uniref:2209_t:CDS:1 n=1 Tax=Paraglomus brasilianum TaxID=144538 RepID=A0A9N9B842_9GLOM|nr:2209_t:CDS:1 [Paraglomus brasilianum]
MKTETERHKTQTFSSKQWTEGDDQILLNALARHSDNWELIAKRYFPRVRTPADLISRYDWLLALDIAADAPPSGAKWTEKEMQALCAAVQIHGTNWNYITNNIFRARRTENALRYKWSELSSDKSLKNPDEWTEEEIKTLLVAVSRVGTDWDLILREYFHSTRDRHSVAKKWNYILWKRKVNLHGLDINSLPPSKGKAIARRLLERLGYKDKQKKKTAGADKSKVTKPSVKPSVSARWTDSDIKKLRAAVTKYGTVWDAIVHECFPHRTPEAVRKRWNMVCSERKKVKADTASKSRSASLRVTRHSWKPADIRKLRAAVAKHGENEWQLVSTKYFNSLRSPEAAKRKWREIMQTNVELSDSSESSVQYPSSDDDTSSDFSISSQRPWTEADSEILRIGVTYVGTDWKRLAHDFFYNKKAPNILSRRWNLIKNRFPKKLNKAVQTDPTGRRIGSISSEQSKSVSRWRPWTEDDIRNLYIGIREYGSDWQKIADKIFRKSRTAGALYCKWTSLENPTPTKKVKSITKKKISKKNMVKKTADRSLLKKPSIVEDLWTDMELVKLREGFQNFRDDWNTIAKKIFQGTRSPETLSSTWNALQTDGSLTEPWTEEEIEKLRAGFQEYNTDWSRIAEEHFNGSRTPGALNRCWELLRDKGVLKNMKLSNEKTSPTRANKWTEEEEKLLIKASDECEQDWELISRKIFQLKRTSEALKRKYFSLMKSNAADETYHIPWSSEDHQTLLDAVERYGMEWEFISKRFFNGTRTARTLRRRYIVIMQKTSPDAGEVWSLNLRSGTKRWSSAETETLRKAFEIHGEKWDYISRNCFSSKRSADYLRLKWEEIKSKTSGKLPGPSSGRKCEKTIETTIKKPKKNEKRVENVQPCLPETAHISGRSGDKWTEAESQILLKAVTEHGPDWHTISREVFGTKRSIFGLKARWKRICQDQSKNVIVKQEDEKCFDKERKLSKQKLQDNLRSTIRGYNAKTRLNRRGVKLAKRVRRVGEKWTEKETVKLWKAVTTHGLKWKQIARDYFNSKRRPAALEGRWYRTRSRISPFVPIMAQKLPSWTEAETEWLRTGVRKFGKNWSLLARECFPSRTPSSLEKRWAHIHGDDPQAEGEDIEPDYDDEELPVESTVEANSLSCDSGTELELEEDEIETEEEDVGMASLPLGIEQRNLLPDSCQQRN